MGGGEGELVGLTLAGWDEVGVEDCRVAVGVGAALFAGFRPQSGQVVGMFVGVDVHVGRDP